jgi:hypothetical protein
VSDHADGWRSDTRTSSDTVAVRYADQLRHAFAQAPGEHDGVWWLRWRRRHQATARRSHYQRRALTSR